MPKNIDIDQIATDFLKPRDTHGVEYDQETGCIVFTHMYDHGYNINLKNLQTPESIFKELQQICSKPQITKEHISEFIRLAALYAHEGDYSTVLGFNSNTYFDNE